MSHPCSAKTAGVGGLSLPSLGTQRQRRTWRRGPDRRERFQYLGKEVESIGGVTNRAEALPTNILGAILHTLPVVLSFIDENETVRYSSQGHLPKVFARTRGVVGSKV